MADKYRKPLAFDFQLSPAFDFQLNSVPFGNQFNLYWFLYQVCLVPSGPLLVVMSLRYPYLKSITTIGVINPLYFNWILTLDFVCRLLYFALSFEGFLLD